jgi:hypothetical protein
MEKSENLDFFIDKIHLQRYAFLFKIIAFFDF